MTVAILGWIVLLVIAIIFGLLALSGFILTVSGYGKTEGVWMMIIFGLLFAAFAYATKVNIPFMCQMIS